MSLVIKKDKKLANVARNIFGSIVQTAYVAIYDPLCSNNELLQSLEKISKNLHYSENLNNISFDGENILIQFKGGNLVQFSNSEWGSISRIDQQLKRI